MAGCTTASAAGSCNKACLEEIADQYRAAYLAHDLSKAPFAAQVRYTENNVEMPFPDGTWDTVTEMPGPVLTISDPVTGQAAIFTPIRQRAVPGFLTVRFKVVDGKITEAEHIISTARNLSSPPTPIGKIEDFAYDPTVDRVEPPAKRLTRAQLAAHANGYFDTLQHNDGEIRGTCFHEHATRRENMMMFDDIKQGFESGRYLFNNRVRRDIVLVDEARQIALGRGFIDHKGVLDTYKLTDGTETKSIFQEPQSWGLLEAFKVTDGCIAAVVAGFYQAPYYTISPWTEEAAEE
ncbi:hypothetical protein GRI89_10365 [Altererythrobacter salegens]|uniref:DUF8021 domain-containing protein n=1 Tax=Croceibacterium salegens TaxID=1737568 RepID=A0A6I4T022_9SPHN|nr:hypothetical protein [Croceibacterium salegens]